MLLLLLLLLLLLPVLAVHRLVLALGIFCKKMKIKKKDEMMNHAISFFFPPHVFAILALLPEGEEAGWMAGKRTPPALPG